MSQEIPGAAQTAQVSKKNNLFVRRFLKVAGALIVAALIILGGYFLIPKGDFSAKRSRDYSQSWRLVPEKISRSAPIRVYAPQGMTVDQVAHAVTFEPEIEGEWIADEVGLFDLIGVAYGQAEASDFEYAQFKPDDPLTEGSHYSVKLALSDGNYMSSDFLAWEDPKIDAILPKGDMEAPEDSKITIVFNRPMVALSTADMMEPKDPPVDLIPETDGKWKWISTNTLQFIPQISLKASATYKVKVGSGLKSLDGLEVAPAEATFETRNLRYLDAQVAVDVVYNEPYRLYFNQPVDLEKTISEIEIFDDSLGKEVQFVADYKKIEKNDAVSQNPASGPFAQQVGAVKKYFSEIKASIFDSVGQKDENYDKSVIEIYPKKDKFGREKFWNTYTRYEMKINKAYPIDGDISVNEIRNIEFTSSEIISGMAQIDGRSGYNGKDMFDPQGRLAVYFYEPIDIAASSFSASVPIVKKEYGQKCDDPNFDLSDSNCNKVDDTKTVVFAFDASKTEPGQTITLRFEKVVNFSGIKINGESLDGKLTVYPKLDYRLATSNGSVELNTLTICSNNPLAVPEKKDFGTYIEADKDLEIFSWDRSWRRSFAASRGEAACNEGEFETDINVGLTPNSAYGFGLRLADVYGQVEGKTAEVVTGPMDDRYVSLFAMQQGTSVTLPSETKLTYGAKNITYADLTICKLGAYDFYRWKDDLDYYDYPIPSNCVEQQTRRIEIGGRYWLNNYFDVDITQGFSAAMGNYIVALTHPQHTGYNGGQAYVTNFVTVTRISAAQKAVNTSDYISEDEISLTSGQFDELRNIYWVSDMGSLAPLSGAKVTLYSGSKAVGDAVTDSSGIATIKPVAGADLAIVDYNGDSTVIGGWDTRMNWASTATNVRRAYIYSDRPIYRPGDKVNIRGILRLGYDGNYQMWEKNQAVVTIRDPRWDTAATLDVDLDEFGTFGTEYTLDSEAALGNYEVCVGGSYNCGNFSVKEYVPAAFRLAATSDKEEYVSKDNVKIDVLADYYFGVPVANAEVEYTISSQNYYFDKYRERGYNFGFYEECESYYCYGDKFIGRGSLTLDSEGTGTIEEIIDLQKIAGQDYANSRIVVFDITATNSMGQSISAQKSIIIHAGGVYVGAKADPYFVSQDKQVAVEAVAVDPQGEAASAKDVKAVIYKVDWVYAKRLEAGGAFNYDWTRKRDEVSTINLNSKGNGKYSGNTAFKDVGQYEIDITANDDNGNKVMSREYVYVYGSGVAGIRLYNDSTLTLKAEDDSLDEGQKGSLIIESPFDKAKALVAIERGRVFKYEIIDISGNLYDYTFDAQGEYAPNVYVSVLLQSADPAVKFGSQAFTVNSDNHKLTVDVSSDKKTYKPGETVALNVHASDSSGKPVSARVSVAVVDLSVLALAGNPKKDPLVFFYDGFPLTVATSSSMKEVLVKVDKDSLTKGGSGGGNSEADDSVRGEFRDTAFWKGDVTTGSDGNVRVEFALPDNLTTWQAEAVGVTKDTKLGTGYMEFMSKNDLMVVPVKPRFIVPGDEFYVAAQVFNQSDSDRKVGISFASETLNFIGQDKNITSKIKSGQSKTVYFKVQAPLDQTKGIHSFTISADGGGIDDAVRQTIPVVANLTYEAVATANYVTSQSAAEAVYLPANVSTEQGSLTVRSSATLAVFLTDALNYFVAYPYGCTEQISSRLTALAAVRAGLNVPNLSDKFDLDVVWINEKQYTIDELIDIGLARVYNNQGANGGFGLWESSFISYYTTLEAVRMLKAVKAAGVEINQDSLDRALAYLDREFVGRLSKMDPNQIVATAAVLIDDTGSDVSYKGNARAAINTLLATSRRDSILTDKLSNKSLAQLSIMLSDDDFANALKEVNAALDNRITIDSRGAFLQAKRSADSEDIFESTIGDTALYLKSLAAGERDTVYTDKVVRWILSSRDRDGSWGTTQNNLAVVTAFTDYLNWKNETEAEFTLTTALNGGQIDKKDFNAKTILDQSVARIAADKFKTGQINIVAFEKDGRNKSGGFYYDMGLKYYLKGLVLARDEGFSVSRDFYALNDEKGETPLETAKPGDVLREHLEITLGRDRRAVAIEDYIPAGMEIVDMELATEQKSLRFTDTQVRYRQLNPDYTELRDDRAFIYAEYLPAGTYEFDYYVRALAKGEYLQLPCVVSEFYNPENFGRTASRYFDIK